MPKVKFNKLIDSLSGRVGNLIFYEADGQNLSRAMPEVTAERTEKQQANSGRFLAAAQKYAAMAVARDNPGNISECQRWQYLSVPAA